MSETQQTFQWGEVYNPDPGETVTAGDFRDVIRITKASPYPVQIYGGKGGDIVELYLLAFSAGAPIAHAVWWDYKLGADTWLAVANPTYTLSFKYVNSITAPDGALGILAETDAPQQMVLWLVPAVDGAMVVAPADAGVLDGDALGITFPTAEELAAVPPAPEPTAPPAEEEPAPEAPPAQEPEPTPEPTPAPDQEPEPEPAPEPVPSPEPPAPPTTPQDPEPASTPGGEESPSERGPVEFSIFGGIVYGRALELPEVIRDGSGVQVLFPGPIQSISIGPFSGRAQLEIEVPVTGDVTLTGITGDNTLSLAQAMGGVIVSDSSGLTLELGDSDDSVQASGLFGTNRFDGGASADEFVFRESTGDATIAGFERVTLDRQTALATDIVIIGFVGGEIDLGDRSVSIQALAEQSAEQLPDGGFRLDAEPYGGEGSITLYTDDTLIF